MFDLFSSSYESESEFEKILLFQHKIQSEN